MMVVEGIDNCDAAVKLSRKFNLNLPIINQVYEVLYQNKDTKIAMIELMNRSAKSEI